MLTSVGIIKAEHDWFDVEHINEANQNILVCVEMVFFAMIQMSAYSAAPYKAQSAAKSKLEKKEQWVVHLVTLINTDQVLNNESAIMVCFQLSQMPLFSVCIWKLWFGLFPRCLSISFVEVELSLSVYKLPSLLASVL